MSTTSITAGPAHPRAAELTHAGVNAVMALLPSLVAAVMLRQVVLGHKLAFDFRWAYYRAATRLVHGISPYQQSKWALTHGAAFVYPPFSAIVFAPFTLLNVSTGTQIYMYIGFVCGPLTLAVLRVRDWRVYAILMLWLPFEAAWQVGNVSLPLALLIALAWRYRDRPLVAGCLVALAISIKPFVWPVGLWLLATRRWKAAAWVLGSGLAMNLLAWWIVGFDQIHTFLTQSSQDAGQYWHFGYSVTAVVHYLGGGRVTGELVTGVVALSIALAIFHLGRRGRHREALAATVALTLVASPVLWSHYFVLLMVPLAICRPKLSIAWLAPALLWFCPASTTVDGWQAAEVWAVTALVLTPLVIAPGRLVRLARLRPAGSATT